MRQRAYCVEVIATGDELLFGRIIDTNSPWIARRSAEMGAMLRRVTCVGDDVDEIAAVLKEALTRGNDLIVFTGGLGPSEDDLTVEAIGKAVGRKVVLDQGALDKIRCIYAERGVRTTTRGERMACILEGAKPISNPVGMATGMILQEGGATIVTFPGVPEEMKAMFDKYVAHIIEDGALSRFLARTVMVRIVWKDFFPMYRQIQRDYPGVYIKNAATPPEAAEERLNVKDIKVDIVVEGATREESETRMDVVLRDFRSRIETLEGRLIE